MKYKAIIRVDGSHEIGMGHIFSQITLAKKLKDFEILFVSKYEEGINKIREFDFDVEKIPSDFKLKEEIDLIKKINKRFKSRLIITDLIGEDYQTYCKELSKLNKTLVVDYFGNIEVYSNVLLNFDVVTKYQNYIKKNKNTIYCIGPRYFISKEQISFYHNLEKVIRDNVESVLITIGGGDRRNLTPRIIDALKDFKDINFNIVIGSAFKNKDKIKTGAKKNNLKYNLIENLNNLSKLIYESDLVISAGGLTSFELAAIGTPFIGFSTSMAEPWEEERLKRMEELGICRYAGDWNFKKENLNKIFKFLVNNKKERENMSVNGKRLLDGRGSDRVVKVIKELINKS